MLNHTKKFENLKRLFNEINTYLPGINVDIEKICKLFIFELMEVTTQFEAFHKIILKDDECIMVQNWINKITGNKNISRSLRRRLLEESIIFNEMVESFNNSIKDSLKV